MIELLQGDCLEIMPTLAPQSFDAIIADIPYGTTACSWDTVIPFAPMWEQLKRLAKPRAAIVLFGSQPFTSALVMSNPRMFKYQWIWNKSQVSNPQLSKFQPLKTVEELVVFGNGRTNYYPQGLSNDVSKVVARRGDWKRTLNAQRRLGHIKISEQYSQTFTNYPKSIISFPTKRNGVEHPTQKPVALMEYLIRTYTNEGDTVLDFTMGSGSTLVAAVNTNRNGVGIELREDYYTIAQRRIAEAQAQMTLSGM